MDRQDSAANGPVERHALTDLDEICGVVNPSMARINARVRIWDSRTIFRFGPFDDPGEIPVSDIDSVQELTGETHEQYLERLAHLKNENRESTTVRLLEGNDPLRVMPLSPPSLSLLSSTRVAGVDSTLATIDQFDDVLAITSGDLHWYDSMRDFQSSRTDLYVMNPRLIKSTIPDKVHKVLSRSDVLREISKAMRRLEYGLAESYGAGRLVIMDGTLFGHDKHLPENLIRKGIVFCSVVKNPISSIIKTWYGEMFNQYGYEGATIDAVAYNDMLKLGTRSPLLYMEMKTWGSRIFSYYKPSIPGATVLRIELPADYSYLTDRILAVVQAACYVNGDPYNSTAAPVVNAEYVAKATLPDPYQMSEFIRSRLKNDARTTRMQGSYNQRRSPFAN